MLQLKSSITSPVLHACTRAVIYKYIYIYIQSNKIKLTFEYDVLLLYAFQKRINSTEYLEPVYYPVIIMMAIYNFIIPMRI